MDLKFLKTSDNWQDIKNTTMTTIGKDEGIYPSSEWKKKLLFSEHSPSRRLKINWKWFNLKYWISVHFVRHKIGIEHWVSTQRDDRTITLEQNHISREKASQDSLISHECEANAQALINISRKRLCSCASVETRQAWQLIKDNIAKVEPELAECMVRECVYRNGLCPEFKSCGFNKTEGFEKQLKVYISGFENQINDKTLVK